jgi:hypothetical protein
MLLKEVRRRSHLVAGLRDLDMTGWKDQYFQLEPRIRALVFLNICHWTAQESSLFQTFVETSLAAEQAAILDEDDDDKRNSHSRRRGFPIKVDMFLINDSDCLIGIQDT